MASITPPDGFRHHLPLQVRWGDMDALGHVNNAKYLTYFEQARIDYSTRVWQRGSDGVGLIMARAVIDYKAPLFAGDDVHVFTRCARIGNRSFDMEQWVVRWQNDSFQIAAQATITIVAYDYAASQSTRVPDKWREQIAAYEGRAF